MHRSSAVAGRTNLASQSAISFPELLTSAVRRATRFLLPLALGSLLAVTATAQTVGQGVVSAVIPLSLSGFALPQVRVGLAYEVDRMNTPNEVTGTGGGIYLLPFHGFRPGIEVYGVRGNRFGQGKLGVSYGLLGFGVRLGVRGEHGEIGVGYGLGAGFQGYVGVNSVGKFDAYPESSAASGSGTLSTGQCPNGHFWFNGSCIS